MPEAEFQQLVDLCRSTHTQLQGQAARSIDLSLVVRNWLFGWYIVEFEGGGAARAELYGKQLIGRLAAELKGHGLKGTSPTNSRKCREFYLGWVQGSKRQQALSVGSPDDAEIQQTVSVESFQGLMAKPDITPKLLGELAQPFLLGWSHYVALLTVSDRDERRFYEIEAAANSWSVRELERQIDSALYQTAIIDKLRHQDLGRMQMNVNTFDRHVKLDDEAPTIGILLCHRKNDALVELTLPANSNIYASKCHLYLPSKEELRQKLMDWVGEVQT